MDRISSLPDLAVDHILSFLPIRDVIATSLLSRRWRYQWKSVPVLNFSVEFDSSPNSPTFISQFLDHYTGLMIKSFTVSLNANDSSSDFWDSCLQFAVDHKVEELDLSIRDQIYWNLYIYKLKDLYVFPLSLVKCQHLKKLRMAGGGLNIPLFQFRHLKEIVLISMKLSDVDTSGCPLLEKLVISMCNSKRSLNIYSPNQRLRIVDIKDSEDVLAEDTELMIYAPHILSVRFSGFLRSRYRFKNLRSLVEATFCFTERFRSSKYYGLDDLEDAFTLTDIIRDLSFANSMALCPWCMQVLSYIDAKGSETPLINAKSLVLTTSLSTRELSGMACILRNCHTLKNLVINIRGNVHTARVWKLWPHYIKRPGKIKTLKVLESTLSSQLHLKTVKINNFLATSCSRFLYDTYETLNLNRVLEYAKAEIDLVRFFLRVCKKLDKMIVHTNKRFLHFNGVEVDENWNSYRWPLLVSLLNAKLLAFWKASGKAKVLVS